MEIIVINTGGGKAGRLCERIEHEVRRNSGKLDPPVSKSLETARQILVTPAVQKKFSAAGGFIACAALHEEPGDMERAARKIDLTHRLGIIAVEAYLEDNDGKKAASAMLSFGISIAERVLKHRGVSQDAPIDFIADAAQFLTAMGYGKAGERLSQTYAHVVGRNVRTRSFLEASRSGELGTMNTLLANKSGLNVLAVDAERRTALMNLVDNGSVAGVRLMLEAISGIAKNERLAYVNYASDGGFMNALYLTGGVFRRNEPAYSQIAEILVEAGARPGMPRAQRLEHDA